MTTKEVAQGFGISQQRATQIEQEALAKCQRWLARHDLALEDLVEG